MALCKINNKQTLFRRLFDAVLLVLASGLVGVFYSAVATTKRGFFCDDETIRYPAVDSETVSAAVLGVFVVGAPLQVILITEILNGILWNKRAILESFLEFCRLVLVVLFTLAVTMVIVFICKTTIGYPRPNFIAMCQPDWSKINCAKGVYVTDITCLNKNLTRWQTINIRQSFMSGHAAMSASASVFIAVYGEFAWRFPFSKLLKPILQVTFLGFAIFVSLTRVQDHVHHWQDVLAGFVTGSAISVWMVIKVAQPKLDEEPEEVPLTMISYTSDDKPNKSVTSGSSSAKRE